MFESTGCSPDHSRKTTLQLDSPDPGSDLALSTYLKCDLTSPVTLNFSEPL